MTLKRLCCLATIFAAAPALSLAQTVDASTAIRLDKAAKARKGTSYVGVFGGATSGQTYKVGGNAGGDFEAKEKSGTSFFGIEVGYSWKTKGLLEPSLEFEAFFLQNEVSAHTTEDAFAAFIDQEASNEIRDANRKKAGIKSTDNAAFVSDINAVVFMLNAQIGFDFKYFQPWIPEPTIAKAVASLKPYIGAGVGGAQLWFRNTEALNYGELLSAAQQEFPSEGQFIGGEQVEVVVRSDGSGGFERRTVTTRTDADGRIVLRDKTPFAPYSPPSQFPEVPGAPQSRLEKIVTNVPSRPGFSQVAYVTTTTNPDGSSRRVVRYELEDNSVAGLQGRGLSKKELLKRAKSRGYRNKAANSASIASGTTSTFSEDRFVFAYQWFAGLEVKLSDRFSLYGEYREITLDSFEPVREFKNEVWNAGVKLRY